MMYFKMSTTGFPESRMAQLRLAASRTVDQSASFSPNDNAACAGLVDGNVVPESISRCRIRQRQHTPTIHPGRFLAIEKNLANRRVLGE